MMVADMTYDGASIALWRHRADLLHPPTIGRLRRGSRRSPPIRRPRHRRGARASTLYPNPAGSLMALIFDGAGPENLSFLATVGFWTHSTLVLVFANLLPHSKHFHIITAIPNVFARDLAPPGRLGPWRENAEKLRSWSAAAGEAARALARARRHRAHRALHVEGDPRLLHVHRVRALLGQLPGAQDGEDP